MTRQGVAPTQYFGGKQQLAPRIVALLPPHDVYCEPYFGAGAVYFTKPPSPLEIINDRDSLVVNFFRVLRDPVKGARLREALDITPYAREEWADCRLSLKRVAQMGWRDAADDVELARRWFVATQQSFAGRITNGPAHENPGWRFTTKAGHNNARSYRTAIERLSQFTARLRDAHIEHDDALAVIARYDGPRCVMYLDPPYLPDTRSGGGYAHEMTYDDHAALLDLITARGFKSAVVLSGYDSALYRERLEVAAGWQRIEITVACSAAGRVRAGGSKLQGKGAVYREGQTRTEILWLNPAAQRAQGLWAGLPVDDEADGEQDEIEPPPANRAKPVKRTRQAAPVKPATRTTRKPSSGGSKKRHAQL
jgi:DNA adenine methylase